jgi:hypothetical protein
MNKALFGSDIQMVWSLNGPNETNCSDFLIAIHKPDHFVWISNG